MKMFTAVGVEPLRAGAEGAARQVYRRAERTGDMIERCRKAGLPEPKFTLTDGFVITIRGNPEYAFETVGGKKRTRTGQG